MIYARCLPTELLLERRAPALSHAERLRVEGHLATCERCRREHVAMVELLEIVEERVQSAAKPGVQERAIARAMLRSRDSKVASQPVGQLAAARLRPARALGLSLAAAALLVLTAAGLYRVTNRGSVTPASLSIARAGDRLLSGSLKLDGAKLAAGDVFPNDRELRVEGPLVVNLAHAQLSVSSAEAIVWSAEKRAVTLRGATAQLKVDPSRHQSFRVVTPHFLVDVVGTEFRVTPDTVAVTSGRVRVLSTEESLLAEVGAGQSWTQPPQVKVADVDRAESAGLGAPPLVSEKESDRAPLAKKALPSLSAAELLARARSRLSSGDAGAARADVDTMLAAGGSRSERAEAYMLKADCALVEGSSRAAVRQYLDVSQRFAGLRAAETALFAAARVESNSGNKAEARKLLELYSERYPSGQFRSEVLTRLRILDGK